MVDGESVGAAAQGMASRVQATGKRQEQSESAAPREGKAREGNESQRGGHAKSENECK